MLNNNNKYNSDTISQISSSLSSSTSSTSSVRKNKLTDRQHVTKSSRDKVLSRNKSDLFNYAIYHKNCQDGFSSLIVLLKSKKLSRDATIYHDVPSATTPPKDIDNKNVIIMDVAYKYDVIKEIFERAKSVVFIDHHVSIRDDVAKLSEKFKKKVEIIYDVNESGASLTWKYFFKNEKMPLFIKYIRDNDIGAWKMKDTKPFIYSLKVKYDIDLKRDVVDKWKNLFNDENTKKLVQTGKIYEEYANSLLDENVRKYTLEAFPSEKIYHDFPDHFKKPGQYRVAVVCGGGCPSSTLLALRLLESVACDFVIMWTYIMDKKEYVLSFRSKEVDVSTIAQIFGGGGHKLASACSFSVSKYHIQDLFFANSLPRKNL
jgi:oligoribonuclease NrnB/cAMP/cGMP phosphodiesterase (DHH superfamily)